MILSAGISGSRIPGRAARPPSGGLSRLARLSRPVSPLHHQAISAQRFRMAIHHIMRPESGCMSHTYPCTGAKPANELSQGGERVVFTSTFPDQDPEA